jgi:hypothetical protein
VPPLVAGSGYAVLPLVGTAHHACGVYLLSLTQSTTSRKRVCGSLTKKANSLAFFGSANVLSPSRKALQAAKGFAVHSLKRQIHLPFLALPTFTHPHARFLQAAIQILLLAVMLLIAQTHTTCTTPTIVRTNGKSTKKSPTDKLLNGIAQLNALPLENNTPQVGIYPTWGVLLMPKAQEKSVETTGLEPVTSALSRQRSEPTELRPA